MGDYDVPCNNAKCEYDTHPSPMCWRCEELTTPLIEVWLGHYKWADEEKTLGKALTEWWCLPCVMGMKVPTPGWTSVEVCDVHDLRDCTNCLPGAD